LLVLIFFIFISELCAMPVGIFRNHSRTPGLSRSFLDFNKQNLILIFNHTINIQTAAKIVICVTLFIKVNKTNFMVNRFLVRSCLILLSLM